MPYQDGSRIAVQPKTRNTAELFADFIRSADLDALLATTPDTISSQTQRVALNFALALLRDDDLVAASARITALADLAQNNRGHIECMCGPIFIVTFGILDRDSLTEAEACRRRFVTEASDQLLSDIAILHGTAPGVVGLFGGRTRHAVGALLHNFSELIRFLARLQFGEVQELRGSSPAPRD